jgi:hypothetical protein
VMGAAHSAADSSAFRSDGGRALAGGGGIVPDVLLDPDTLTTPEQGFTLALNGQLTAFRDVLTAYALELRRGGTVASEAFQVDQAMRDEVRHRLAARGVQMADSTFLHGTKILDEQLGYEVARYVFGAAAERRRRVGDDPQIGRAAELLRQVTTPSALLGLASGSATRAH